MNGDYRGLYETQALDAASKAGVPGEYLHPSGWNGDEDDLRGLFAEQVYRLGDVDFTAPDAIEQMAGIIDVMQRFCRSFGVDPKAAIPYGMARFKRRLFESREHHAAITRGDELPLASEADVCWGSWSNNL